LQKMQTFLLAIGAIAAAVGVFAIGFGIEIYDFSFGNTLIIVGTTSVMGGTILVGLAVAIRELTRIADAVSARLPLRTPARPQATAGADASASAGRRDQGGQGGQANRPAYPSASNSEPAARDSRPVEPRLAVVPSPEDLDEPTVVRPRQNIYPLVRPGTEPRVVEDLDSIALSPRSPPRATKGARVDTARAQEASHPKLSDQLEISPGAGQARANDGGVSTQMTGGQSAILEASRMAPTATPQQSEQMPRVNLFDSVWPASAKPRAQFANEAVARDLDSTPPAAARDNVEPMLSTPKREDANPPHSQNEPRPVSILKSGIIDGMAYTLYTDGSIEAQLAQNTIRFNSIDDLREHLENSV
jgi:hypothetical protein